MINLSSCSFIEQIAGVNYDIEEFQLNRQLKIKELTYNSAKLLQKKLSNKNILKQSDIIINLNEKFLNKLFSNYRNHSAWIDAQNSYYIKDIQIKLLNGVGIATLNLIVNNIVHDIKVTLESDCLILIEKQKDSLKLKLEPFNITPIINSKGFYKIFNTTIDKSIRLNLAEISKKLPGIPIPFILSSNFKINGINKTIKSGINLNLQVTDINLNYEFSINDILFLKNQILILLELSNLSVQ